MLFLITILLGSWLLLKLNGDSLLVLGVIPTKQRITQFLIGILSFGLLAGVYFMISIMVLNPEIRVNTEYSFFRFLSAAWWVFRSVLFEEFLFRGALLFITLKYLGENKAILISSFIFGIYHWFSYEVFGDLISMIYVFVITGIGGCMFAFAFARTRSLFLPVGLHYGWNLVTIIIFSEGPIGDQLFTYEVQSTLEGGWRLFLFLFLYQVVFLPLITILLVKYSLTFNEEVHFTFDIKTEKES